MEDDKAYRSLLLMILFGLHRYWRPTNGCQVGRDFMRIIYLCPFELAIYRFTIGYLQGGFYCFVCSKVLTY